MEGSLKHDDPVYIVADIFRNVLGGRLSDISSLIEFYNSNNAKHTVSKIYIIGIASKISGICEYVQTTLGIETEKVKAFDRVYFGEKAIKNLKPRQVTLETCLGAVPLGNKKITLLKSDLQLAKWYKALNPMVYKVGVMIACLMILVLCAINLWTHFIEEEVKEYKALIAGKSDVIELHDQLLEITKVKDSQMAQLNAIPDGMEKHLISLGVIEKYMESYPTIKLGSYTFKENSVSVSGCSAPDESTFWMLEEDLRDNEWDCAGRYTQFSIIFTFEDKVFNDENHRKAWLIRVTLICCKRMHAINKKHQYVLIDDIDVSVQFEYEDDKNVYQAVLSLPDNLKSVIYLYYFEELSAKEIGNILKIRESTVFMRLSRGRALLKERLGSDYDL